MNQLWEKVLVSVKERISAQNFDAWIKPLRPASTSNENEIELLVINDFFADRLHSRFGVLIEECLAKSAGKAIRVKYRVENSGANSARQESLAPPPPPPVSPVKQRALTGIDPRYTFSSFVVGTCNQFVHAAAKQVAESPSTSYNPFYIYGGVGLGKTHVMQAIGNQALLDQPAMKVLYISSEKFMTQLINSIRFNKMAEFHENFRTVDMLIVDDIQFIAGKERTQEEFFHTFNALFESNKQIIISSDRSPNEIDNLEERLSSRFGWGLVADIQPPELETRIAILKKKAAVEGLELPDDIAFFLANAIQNNVRELEGALIRVKAFASLTNKALSLEMVKETLRDIVKGQDKQVSLENIVKLVANYYKVRPADMRSDKRTRMFTNPRQVAMYLCKQLTTLSYPEIGHQFGGRDHTTVIHAVRKITEQKSVDSVLAEELESLIGMLRK